MFCATVEEVRMAMVSLDEETGPVSSAIPLSLRWLSVLYQDAFQPGRTRLHSSKVLRKRRSSSAVNS